MLELTFRPRPAKLRETRRTVTEELLRQGMGSMHASDVAVVVNELIGAACECEVTTPLQLSVATYPLMTSVRLRCDRKVELRDKPFDVRERLIQSIAIAFGRRRRDDGSFDIWAEIARR